MKGNECCRRTYDLQTSLCSCLVQYSRKEATDLAKIGPKFPRGAKLEAFFTRRIWRVNLKSVRTILQNIEPAVRLCSSIGLRAGCSTLTSSRTDLLRSTRESRHGRKYATDEQTRESRHGRKYATDEQLSLKNPQNKRNGLEVLGHGFGRQYPRKTMRIAIK